jgi:hypothetical protein
MDQAAVARRRCAETPRSRSASTRSSLRHPEGRAFVYTVRAQSAERARLSPDWKIELFDLEVELAFRACCFGSYLNGHYLLPIDTRASFCSQSI